MNTVQNQEINVKPDGLFRMVLNPDDAPAQLSAAWVSQPDPLPPAPDRTDPASQVNFVQAQQDLKFYFKIEYPLRPNHSAARIADNLLGPNGDQASVYANFDPSIPQPDRESIE